MAESTQHRLDRTRPPRVQITYDVQVGDAIETKEIPFVVGVMSDLAGAAAANLPPLKERKFVTLDPDTFNDVMAGIKPSLALRVENKLEPESETLLNVALTFESIDDFNPASIVRQVDALRQLFEARQRLTDLIAKLDGNDALDGLLQNIITNTDELHQLKAQLGGTGNGQEN